MRHQRLIAAAFLFWGFSASSSEQLSQRGWEEIAVPGATCGNGDPYSIYISRRDPAKVAIHLMGGGACWSLSTCIGPTPLTSIRPRLSFPHDGGIVASDSGRSPVSDHTLIYVPYCTGDVHAGTHVAKYGAGFFEVRHVGALNIQSILKNFEELTSLDLGIVDDFVLSGFSAGAIGALVHARSFDQLFSRARRKTLVADAPGLHFGPDFWDKFTPELNADYAAALSQFGLRPKAGNGNIARTVPILCALLPDWQIGVLQGSRDVVMSRIFGAVSSSEHEAMVYGPEGVYEMTLDPNDNCSSWIPETSMHTFLVTDRSSKIATSGKRALDFTADLVTGQAGRNFR